MIWDQFFLTRVAIAYGSIFVGCSWIFGACFQFGFLTQINALPTVTILLLTHSFGLFVVSAGFFGRRYVALSAIFFVGLLWFAAAGIILREFFSSSGLKAFHLSDIFFAICFCASGLMLFVVTCLLVKTSSQPLDHFRSDF